MGLDRMPKRVEEVGALLVMPFVVTVCWFWLIDSYLQDAETIVIDPVSRERGGSGRVVAELEVDYANERKMWLSMLGRSEVKCKYVNK